ncbi:MAG: phosphopantothenoylcysteine decarboxylase [Lentisphaerae bacterium]|nr:phosphopantothenoylcysteine decarboxylase [Lentisphaerota bacterium]
MKILVTAGPTREAIDPVRFISNRSSGKMGYACAEAASERGHQVVLVSGPVALEVPSGVERCCVETALEMEKETLARLEGVDALVMAAAVADWRPEMVSPVKLKKNTMVPSISLVRNPDILLTASRRKGSTILVGFAAETGMDLDELSRKIEEKHLDLIVANDVSREDAGFEVDTNKVVLLEPGASPRELPLLAKKEVADAIVLWIENRFSAIRG